jgi:(2Fe-2S) ferredoxin
MSYFELHLFVCCNERASGDAKGSCGAAHGEAVRLRFAEALKAHGLSGKMRANKSGCLHRCSEGPAVVIYPEGVWYRVAEVERDVDEIVREHIVGGGRVERLLLPERGAR